jgi:uncharacterized protein with GYD domain
LPGRGIGVEVPHGAPRDGAERRLTSRPCPEAKGNAMPTYVALCNFTHQGIQNIKDTTKRADTFKTAAKKAGCTVKEIYWTQGQYDNVLILDAPDDASATALLMSLGKLGNVRTQTLRAFTAAELAPILDKVS